MPVDKVRSRRPLKTPSAADDAHVPVLTEKSVSELLHDVERRSKNHDLCRISSPHFSLIYG